MSGVSSDVDVFPAVETLKVGDYAHVRHNGILLTTVWQLVSIERRDGQKRYHFESFPRDGISQLNVVRPCTPTRVVSV